jgi:renalase
MDTPAPSPKRLAILGAGYTGVSAAYALRTYGSDIVLFEKSRGVGGRAATRRQNGVCYDHGANYIKAYNSEVDTLIRDTFASSELVTIKEGVWTFDHQGTIQPSDEQEAAKWTYRDGITHLAKALYKASGATLHTERRLTAIQRTPEGWQVQDETGQPESGFDALLLTAPAPQTLALLESSVWESSAKSDLITALRRVSYRSIFSFILHYPFPVSRPYYALVNPDRRHPIGWLSFEACKAGHVPPHESVLVVQMSPDWTAAHYDTPAEQNQAAVAALVAELLQEERLAQPDWGDSQRWRYALPNEGIDTTALQRAETDGLFCAGDWVAGQGRVHLAIQQGLAIAPKIQLYFQRSKTTP